MTPVSNYQEYIWLCDLCKITPVAEVRDWQVLDGGVRLSVIRRLRERATELGLSHEYKSPDQLIQERYGDVW